ncbi:MAG: aldo/keto reductase [Succinivibrionaceae bacterium]
MIQSLVTPDPENINEELVGTALQHYRHNVQIATKFGVTLENRRLILNSAPEQIEIELEQSLRRQKTDYIDLYYQHRIDPKVEPEAVAEVMAKLAKEGKILHRGISENSEEYLRRAHKVFPVPVFKTGIPCFSETMKIYLECWRNFISVL